MIDEGRRVNIKLAAVLTRPAGPREPWQASYGPLVERGATASVALHNLTRRVMRVLAAAGAELPPIKPSQHCTSQDCELTLSHTAESCGWPQPHRCGCPYCYPED